MEPDRAELAYAAGLVHARLRIAQHALMQITVPEEFDAPSLDARVREALRSVDAACDRVAVVVEGLSDAGASPRERQDG